MVGMFDFPASMADRGRVSLHDINLRVREGLEAAREPGAGGGVASTIPKAHSIAPMYIPCSIGLSHVAVSVLLSVFAYVSA
jgi:hypothetical protein